MDAKGREIEIHSFIRIMKDFCKKYNITEDQFKGVDKIGGYLDLSGLTSIPDGFNPTVCGSLDLRGLTSIPDGFNPTVGGSLYLRGLTSIPDGFNPTVGGSLDLSGLTSIPDGFNPTVGGYLYLRGQSKYIASNIGILEWQDGRYILIDDILSEVIHKRGNTWKVKIVGRKEETYIVTDGNGSYSHGDTIKEAREDLLFKLGNRSKEEYKDLTLESVLKFEDAVVCYRVITGACQAGIKHFLSIASIKRKSYSIQNIIDLTEGQYGNQTFKSFFS
jgi:hypothetical protein